MNGMTQSIEVSPGFWARRNVLDWLFAIVVLFAGVFALTRYREFMDVYEISILVGAVPAMVCLAWFWRPLRALIGLTTVLSLIAIFLYQGDLGRSEQVFWLKYFLSSQSAILWMAVLFFVSTIFYWVGMLVRDEAGAMASTGSLLAWIAVLLALVGTMVRWYESYLIGSDIGHIPVSNLYEVFVLFCWMTTLFYLYFEAHYKTRAVGAFVMLVISAAVGFLLWYTLVREAHEIQPLVPALKSWWMKLHVPANFIGYGTFSLAAMVAFAYLIKEQVTQTRWHRLVPLGLLGVALCLEPLMFRRSASDTLSDFWAIYFGLACLLVAAILFGRRRIAEKLPSLELLDDLMYKSIAVGFAFFTIATVLGALWAAEAWGGYWSWDPKETWALIVWLNYAAWLHMRLMKGLRGVISAWWALIGLAITSFAFLGVNMFLSGLHSYGTL